MSYAQPTTAPGRQPAPGIESAPAPAGPAEAPRGPMDSMFMMLLPVALLVFLMVTSRSQSKKQKQLLEGLKVGDRVVTRAGIVGRLEELGDKSLKVEIAPGVRVSVLRSHIEGLEPTEPSGAKA